MQPDQQEKQKISEKQNTFRTRSADVLANFAYRYRFVLKAVFGIFFIAYFVFATVFLGIRYLVLPNIGTYKTEIEKVASESLGCPVTFSRIEASWYGLQPKIDLEDVRVSDRDGNEVVRLENVSAVVSWWSLPLMDVRLALLQIDKPDIGIMRDGQGHFYIAGMRVEPESQEKSGFADWVLKQHRIVIRKGKLHWRDEFRENAALNLEQVDFVMNNRGRRHRFRLTAMPDSGLAKSLDIRGDLSHPRFEDRVSDLSKWTGELYMDVPDIDIAEWRKFTDLPLGLDNGYGSARVWMTMDGFRPTELVADVGGQNIRLKMSRDVPSLDLRKVTGRFSLEQVNGQSIGEGQDTKPVYSYAVRDLSVRTVSGKKLDDASFSVLYVPGKTEMPDEVKIEIGKLDIGELKGFYPYVPIDPAIRQEIDRFDFSGKLSGFLLNWKVLPENRHSYVIKGDFTHLTLLEKGSNNGERLQNTANGAASSPRYPGFENLTGSVFANEHRGNMQLQSEQPTLVMPFYSGAASQRFDELSARLQWEYTSGNVVKVEIGDLSFLQNDMRVRVSGHYTNNLEDQANRYGFVDATAKIENLNIADVKKYVPLRTPKALSEWLCGALKGGKVSEGSVQLRGNLADFPFTGEKADGLFVVRAKLVDGVLNYTPNMLSSNGKHPLWPDIEKIQGEFKMNGSRLAVHSDQALTNHVELRNVDVVIPDVLSGDPRLDIKGNAEGSLQNFVGFVNLTPVAGWIGNLTEKTAATGNASLALTLQLPLEKPEDSAVSGTLRFNGNDIVLLEDLPVIAGTQGQLHFSEKGFQLEKIKAGFLHESVNVSGGTQSNGRFLVRADGILSARGLQRTYATGAMGGLMQRLSGSTPYTVRVSEGEIRVESSLKGLGIGMPVPLGKPAASTVPLNVVLKDRPSYGSVSRDELDITYGNDMMAKYLRQKGKTGIWHVVQGGIGINRQAAVREGLSLDLSLHNLDFNEWRDVLKNLHSGTGENVSTPSVDRGVAQYVYPRYFSIDADEVVAMDMWLTNARLNGTHQEGLWDIDVRSEQINGRLKWMEGAGNTADGKLVARLKSLNILQSSMKKVSDMTGREDIYRIPSLDIVTDDLTLFGKHLGRTEIVANNVSFKNGREWRINRLKITNPDAALESSGSWVTTAGNRQQTRLSYVLNIKDAGKLLARFGYEDIIRRGRGEMKGDISWDGLPFALDIPSLSGKLSLRVETGQFLKADPGAAKLLSVISLQSLPRRLNLDFRDIFSKGFAFDEITANAGIANGIMRTENLKMNGVNATVMMDGSVDIRQESQDLHVVVIPEINAAAASIAYGFINPAIGIGTFLAQMFLREPLMKQFTHEYHVTGSWSDPVIVEVKAGTGK